MSLPLATRIGKRVLDICCSLGIFLIAAPAMLVTAILVKLTSPGPVVFKQSRVGLNQRRRTRDRRTNPANGSHFDPAKCQRQRLPDRRQKIGYGKPFVIYKFRTMRNDAEKNGAQFATKGDARITPLGRVLRKSRLDELPQLWNVLRGEMSLVGPRPERPEFIGELSAQIPDYLQRLGIKPGLTGVAQIVNGYDNEIEGFRRRIAYDLLYIKNCSVGNDLRILLRTVRVVMTGSGAC